MVLKTPRRVILGTAVVMGVIVLSSQREGDAGGLSRPCVVKVSADKLNVRAGPGTQHPVVDTLTAGSVVPADRLIQDGFRQLKPGRWVAEEYLHPLPGSNCG